AIQAELPELLAAEKLLIIESPRVTTGAPESGKPLSIVARASLAPEVKLPDYKKIAAEHPLSEDTNVSDKEHSEAMAHLRRERSRIDKIEAGTEAQKASEEARAMEEKDLPALDDAFVQSLGYENAEKFSDALRSNIKNEKEIRAREKRRSEILDDLVKESSIKYPAMMREYELNDMEARMTDDLARSGATMEGYLAQIKKSKEELRATWKDAADKRAKVRLILSEIARQEKIEPDAKALEHEISHAKEHYPSADEGALRAHILHAMRNEATLRFLEGDTHSSDSEQATHDH
ncbi:hypothetical protein HY970_01295, partial [Candidatus Kaiserbacteria bacterium]|nr:hypothetical protein [Candidatus Kaiserbacteria bacterium]